MWVLGVVLLVVVSGLAGCDETPTNTGPTVHCFNQTQNTGKVEVVCPTGQ